MPRTKLKKKETKVQRLERLLKSAYRKIKKLEEDNSRYAREHNSREWEYLTGRRNER